MPPNMPNTKMKDNTIERVAVGNISDAIRLADDDAGEPNMNIMQVMSSRTRAYTAHILVKISKTPAPKSMHNLQTYT